MSVAVAGRLVQGGGGGGTSKSSKRKHISSGEKPSHIYSQQTIKQHQAINLDFESSLKPIKVHSCRMEFILISFQSQ